MSRNRHEDRASAPVFRDQFILGQFLFHTFDICTRFVDLVDRNDDLDPCCFRMVDRFYSLRHYTVVRRYDKDRDIGGIGSAHTHCGKCLMSRRIQKCDLFSVDFHNRCTDMLCDTAGFPVDHIGVTDCIQKRGFTMVDVPHPADYRRTFHHRLFILFLFF